MAAFILIGLVLAPLIYFLIQDYIRGLCFAAIMLVSLTHFLRIETPAPMPNFTVQRLIFICVFIAWLQQSGLSKRISEVPFLPHITLLAAANLLSVMFSIEFSFSLKQFLSLTIEIFLFYIMTVTSFKSKQDVFRILKALWIGLTIVAVFAFIERYTGFNPVDRFVPGYVRTESLVDEVISTYPHRILLGTAMAMAWPLSIVLIDKFRDNRAWKYLLIISTGIFFGACYFSQSRGPWIGTIVAAVVVLALSSFRVKKKIAVIACLVILVLVLRPGVWQTLRGRAQTTVDVTSVKGQTYQYRWELWRVAYSEIKKSFTATLFGYGPGSHEMIAFARRLSYTGEDIEVESWDNNYACILLETGFFGLFAVFVIYIAVLWKLLIIWWPLTGLERDVMAGIIAGILVLFFMMTNVYIFAPQLKYLCWILISAGVTFTVSRQSDTAVAHNGASKPTPKPGNDHEQK